MMRNSIRFLVFLLGLLILIGTQPLEKMMIRAAAADSARQSKTEDEDSLFGNGNMVDSRKVVNDEVDAKLKQNRLGLTGELEAIYRRKQYESNWLGVTGDRTIEIKKLYGDLYFDGRLKNGFRTFLSLEGEYDPDTEAQDWSVKELFFDASWGKRIFIRSGKQVLVWGRNYFWNPTDLVNIEQKDFLNLDVLREGVYGLKFQIPAGVRRNTYFFINLDDLIKKLRDNTDGNEISTDDLSLALKYEFLIGNTEMSFSAWTKPGFKPVFGYDFSGKIGKTNLYGEISSSRGRRKLMDYDTLGVREEDGGWEPQVSLGFTRSFRHKDIDERISLIGEVYYNAEGYERNILQQIDAKGTLSQKGFYVTNIYQPYRNSQYYVALFGTVRKFLLPKLTLICNSLINPVDCSGVITPGITFAPEGASFSIYFNINEKFGASNTEAMLDGNRRNISCGAKIVF
jgi:hypothetical protein